MMGQFAAGWALSGRRLPAACLLALWCAGLLAGCTDVRPTIKIGVLAPFEGLHRRSGYATLAAVRAAIQDFSYAEAGILPLAVDDGAQPAAAVRAAQKLLADPRVAAVVGPLSPALADAVGPAVSAAQAPWHQPYSMAGEDWAGGLVRAAAGLAQAQGAAGLVLAGWTPGWPRLDARQWSAAVEFPVRLDDEPGGVSGQEVVFWMGSPEDGAAYLQQLRKRQPAAIFVLGPQGENPVFVERLPASDEGRDRVYWTVWTDAGYTEWVTTHSIQSPNAYLAYRATLAALQSITTDNRSSAPPASWQVQLYRYDRLGGWLPAN